MNYLAPLPQFSVFLSASLYVSEGEPKIEKNGTNAIDPTDLNTNNFPNTTKRMDNFQYYNTTLIVDKSKSSEYWSQTWNYTVSDRLSNTYREVVVSISFNLLDWTHSLQLTVCLPFCVCVFGDFTVDKIDVRLPILWRSHTKSLSGIWWLPVYW